MGAFAFETITTGEAAAYNAAADSLHFDAGGLTGAMATVLFQADGRVSIVLGSRTVAFGAGLAGEEATFGNGSRLFAGGVAADAWFGTDQGDGAYGGQGDDNLSGGGGDDLLQGNQGGDSLAGGAGGDVIYGGQGNDAINVGAGANFGQGNLGADTVRASADAGRNTLLGGQGDDVIIGGNDTDFLNGNLGADFILGGAGGDSLFGEGGGDTLSAGAGADTMTGGADADVFAFEAGSSFAGQNATFVGEVVDRILDWTVADRIDKPGGALPPPGVPGVDPSYYYELSPAWAIADVDYYGPFGPPLPYDYWRARDECVRLMADNPTLDVIAVQSDNDVLVFLDADGGNAPDLAIRLSGVTLDDIGFGNFI
jgi:Ca2+-binding RTX toxin-like protein